MTTFVVEFSPESLNDLERLRRRLRKFTSAFIARRFVDRIISACENLDTFPLRGTARAELSPDVRTFGIRRRTTILSRVIQHKNLVMIEGVYHRGRSLERSYKRRLARSSNLNP